MLGRAWAPPNLDGFLQLFFPPFPLCCYLEAFTFRGVSPLRSTMSRAATAQHGFPLKFIKIYFVPRLVEFVCELIPQRGRRPSLSLPARFDILLLFMLFL